MKHHIIEKLMNGKLLESAQVEFKRDFNPEPIIHTICAFANDIDEFGKGYILMGVEETCGIAQVPVKGLDLKSIDTYQKELINYLNISITPRILPKIEIVEIDDKYIILVTVSKGNKRPYKALENIYTKSKLSHIYIRKGSVTLKAKEDEISALYQNAKHTSFDAQINEDVTVNDLSKFLMVDYLQSIESKKVLEMEKLPLEILSNDLGASVFINGESHVKNVGVMFFHKNPHHYFPYTYIDLTLIKDPTGHNMIEKRFEGPLHIQYESVMAYLKTYVYEIKTQKQPNAWVSNRYENYPFHALEEIIANAILHKDYQIEEPISIRITKSEIEVTSFPGFDHTITDDQIHKFDVRSRKYLNKEIAKYLKELGIVENKNTGYPTILKAMRLNDSKNPVIIMDRQRTYVSIVIKIHESFLETEQPLFIKEDAGMFLNAFKKSTIKSSIVKLLESGTYGITDISRLLGYKSVPGYLKKALKDLLEEELIKQNDKRKYTLFKTL